MTQNGTLEINLIPYSELGVPVTAAQVKPDEVSCAKPLKIIFFSK